MLISNRHWKFRPRKSIHALPITIPVHVSGSVHLSHIWLRKQNKRIITDSIFTADLQSTTLLVCTYFMRHSLSNVVILCANLFRKKYKKNVISAIFDSKILPRENKNPIIQNTMATVDELAM